MYVHSPQTSDPTVSKSKKKKNNNSHKRDSGILVDLFNGNGSVSNLRAKITSATSSIRHSLSTFNLRSLSLKSKAAKKSKRASALSQHGQTPNLGKLGGDV